MEAMREQIGASAELRHRLQTMQRCLTRHLLAPCCLLGAIGGGGAGAVLLSLLGGEGVELLLSPERQRRGIGRRAKGEGEGEGEG